MYEVKQYLYKMIVKMVRFFMEITEFKKIYYIIPFLILAYKFGFDIRYRRLRKRDWFEKNSVNNNEWLREIEWTSKKIEREVGIKTIHDHITKRQPKITTKSECNVNIRVQVRTLFLGWCGKYMFIFTLP